MYGKIDKKKAMLLDFLIEPRLITRVIIATTADVSCSQLSNVEKVNHASLGR